MKNLINALYSLISILSFNALAMDPPPSPIGEETHLLINDEPTLNNDEGTIENILEQYYRRARRDLLKYSRFPKEEYENFLYVLSLEFFNSSSKSNDLWEIMQFALGEDVINTSKYSSHNLKHIKLEYNKLGKSPDNKVLKLLAEINSKTENSRENFYKLIDYILSTKISFLKIEEKQDSVKKTTKKKGLSRLFSISK